MRHSKVGLSRRWEEKTVDRVGGSGGWIRWLKRVGPSGGRVRWLNHVAKRGGKRSGQKRWPDRVAEMRERKGWCPMHHQTRYSDGQTTCPILESDPSCRHHISVRSREATSRRMTLDEFGALVCQTLTRNLSSSFHSRLLTPQSPRRQRTTTSASSRSTCPSCSTRRLRACSLPVPRFLACRKCSGGNSVMFELP